MSAYLHTLDAMACERLHVWYSPSTPDLEQERLDKEEPCTSCHLIELEAKSSPKGRTADMPELLPTLTEQLE